MAPSASYVRTPLDEDGLGAEAVGSSQAAAVPQQLRLARRAAAAALLVSAAAFAAVAAAAVSQRGLFGGAAPAAPSAVAPAAAVGLAAAAPRAGAARRTRAPSAVYLERSTGAEKVRDLPAGSVLLPMNRASGWVQAVVPAQGGEPATMGWVHAPSGFDALLAPAEAGELARPARARVSSMSWATLGQKWETLRAKNIANKARLAELESSMKQHQAQVLGDAGEKLVGQAARLPTLRQGVEKLRQEVKKDFGASPQGVIADIAKAFK